MSANRPTVLILTSDPAFSREITAHWTQDPAPHSEVPDFIVLDKAFARDLKGSNYDLAIADASWFERREHLAANDKSINRDRDRDTIKDDNGTQMKALKRSLVTAGKPAIIMHSTPAADFNSADVYKDAYKLDGVVLELSREPQLWPAVAGLIGREILRRCQAESRARDAETNCAAAQADATLGRYMLEMRTNINNALTTVLGNAELLALEPGLPATVQAQADTIRNMALRLHEVFRRFSSIEKELTVAAREAGKKAAHASAGRS
jgi:hypothetical protein